ncbi:MAG: class I SAM-dependent methyltransferase [Proteobacteria bacterium]|nr:class I SAM-dependent methyltransferase [Pseudomonadota bacterium]
MPSTATPAWIRTRQWARRALGRRGVAVVREVGARLNAVVHRGSGHACPLCGNGLRAFRTLDDHSMIDAECPVCGSLGRHRFLWHVLSGHGMGPAAGESLLHFAPEWPLERRLAKRLGRGYLSADLRSGRAMRVLDLQSLDLPEASFDWILCSHVLEHVPDDHAALAQMRRVLRARGRLLLQVPVRDGSGTLEAPPDASPDYRRQHFGLDDHLRLYGDDLVSRIEGSGFRVAVWDPRTSLTPEQWQLLAADIPDGAGRLFTSQSRLYVCEAA